MSHPTTDGNKHIPTGGSTGKALIYGGASGTATWGDVASELNIVKYDTPGTFTWTVPEGVISVYVSGSGGGGGGSEYESGGGGAGSVIDKKISVIPNQSLSVVIGAGGNAAASGGVTSLGSLISLSGGGGAGVNGGISNNGGASGGAGGSAGTSIFGIGGSSIFGAGEAMNANTMNATGTNASGYGGGGGGSPRGYAPGKGSGGFLLIKYIK
ncbi:glycine-rich domain-containing protein [Sporosarcina sp. ZBG7A]|uniref:glycine-rich domain-containing protein n=1 Tax=Sporosarcina sp. ZBG7A TaxID=1582223 RepID=UPI000689A2AB|nr:hypothetical protein [Sporosarcina sp. ZBG7A]